MTQQVPDPSHSYLLCIVEDHSNAGEKRIRGVHLEEVAASICFLKLASKFEPQQSNNLRRSNSDSALGEQMRRLDYMISAGSKSIHRMPRDLVAEYERQKKSARTMSSCREYSLRVRGFLKPDYKVQHLKRSNSDSALWELYCLTRVYYNSVRIIEQLLGSDEIVCYPNYQNRHKLLISKYGGRVRSVRYPPASENAGIPSEPKIQINSSQCNGNEYQVVIDIELQKEVVESDDKKNLPIIRRIHTCLNQHMYKHKNKNKKTKQIKPVVETDSKQVPFFVMLLMIGLWALLLTCLQGTSAAVVPITIRGSLVELLSFMVFVWGAALTILFGERFSHTHGAIFISWAVLMHVGVDHSISLLFLAILALFFGASHALSSFITPSNNQIQEDNLTSSTIVKPQSSLDLHTMLCI